jgi:hypothetical protein
MVKGLEKGQKKKRKRKKKKKEKNSLASTSLNGTYAVAPQRPNAIETGAISSTGHKSQANDASKNNKPKKQKRRTTKPFTLSSETTSPPWRCL